MDIARMKSAPHYAGGEVGNGKLHDAALQLVAELFVWHYEDLACSVGEVQQRTFERTPIVAAHPEQFAWRTVQVVGDPNKGRLHFGIGGAVRVIVSPHVAVKARGRAD